MEEEMKAYSGEHIAGSVKSTMEGRVGMSIPGAPIYFPLFHPQAEESE